MKSLERKTEPSLDGPIDISFPNFYVSNEQMKEIDNWELGETYEIKVKIKMRDYHSTMTLDGEVKSGASFDMTHYDVV